MDVSYASVFWAVVLCCVARCCCRSDNTFLPTFDVRTAEGRNATLLWEIAENSTINRITCHSGADVIAVKLIVGDFGLKGMCERRCIAINRIEEKNIFGFIILSIQPEDVERNLSCEWYPDTDGDKVSVAPTIVLDYIDNVTLAQIETANGTLLNCSAVTWSVPETHPGSPSYDWSCVTHNGTVMKLNSTENSTVLDLSDGSMTDIYDCSCVVTMGVVSISSEPFVIEAGLGEMASYSHGGDNFITVTIKTPAVADYSTKTVLLVIGVSGGIAGICLAALIYLCRERIRNRGAKSLLICTKDRKPRPQTIDSETSQHTAALSSTTQPNSTPSTHATYADSLDQVYAVVRESSMIQGPFQATATAPTLPRGHPRSERTLSRRKQHDGSLLSHERRTRSTDLLSTVSGPSLPSRLYRNPECPGHCLENDQVVDHELRASILMKTGSQMVKRLSRSLEGFHDGLDEDRVVSEDAIVIRPPGARQSTHFDVVYDNPKYECLESRTDDPENPDRSSQLRREAAIANIRSSTLAEYSTPRKKGRMSKSGYEEARAIIPSPVLIRSACQEPGPLNPFAPSAFDQTDPFVQAKSKKTILTHSGYEDACAVMKDSYNLLLNARGVKGRQPKVRGALSGVDPEDVRSIYLLAKDSDDKESEPEDSQRGSECDQPLSVGHGIQTPLNMHDRDNRLGARDRNLINPGPSYEYHTPNDVVPKACELDDGSGIDDDRRCPKAEFSTGPTWSSVLEPPAEGKEQSLFGDGMDRGASLANVLGSDVAPNLSELVPGLENDVKLEGGISDDECDSGSSRMTEDDYGMGLDDDYVTGELTIRLARGEVPLEDCPSEEEIT